MRGAVAITLATLLLGGCAAIKEAAFSAGKDNSEPPAKLTSIETKIQVTTRWRRSVGGGAAKGYLKLTPAVAGGRVFAAGRKGEVAAFDAKDGSNLWRTKTRLRISGGPGAGDGLVLVGTTDGEVAALSAENGELLWKARVSSEVLAAPRAAGGIVVARTIDGKIFGLDGKEGGRIWLYDRTVPTLTLRGTSAPVIVGDRVIAGFDSGRLVAIKIKNGRTVWEARLAIPRGRSVLERLVDIDAEPVVAGDTVYAVTFQGRIVALDLESGEVIWRRDMSSHRGIGIDRSNLYVTDDESQVWALDRSTGASLWRQNDLRARSLTSPTAFSDYVVVGDFEGYLHWLSREDGAFVARVRIDKDGIAAPPVVADGLLYVYGNGGTLAALEVQ